MHICTKNENNSTSLKSSAKKDPTARRTHNEPDAAMPTAPIEAAKINVAPSALFQPSQEQLDAYHRACRVVAQEICACLTQASGDILQNVEEIVIRQKFVTAPQEIEATIRPRRK